MMRRLSRFAWSLLLVAPVGCKTDFGNHTDALPARPSVVQAKPSTDLPPPPPVTPTVARSMIPDNPAPPTVPPSALSEAPTVTDYQDSAFELVGSGTIQTCPVNPLVDVLNGSRDPQARQEALSALALMLATGTARALRSSGGEPHHRMASNIDDVLQTDDNQSSVSKQRRPPVLFTLGLKF